MQPPLTTIGSVHRLSIAAANARRPVLLRGVVTQTMPGWSGFAFQDATDGIYVQLSSSIAPLPEPGRLVEVRGYSNAGNFAPMVIADGIRDVGAKPLPEPPLVSWQYLASGACDNRYIEIEGIVHSAAPPQTARWKWAGLALHLEVDGNVISAYVRDFTNLNATQLAGAHVRLHGTCAVLSNSRRQFERNILLVRGADDIHILKPAPQDAFALPISPMDRLFSYKPGIGAEPSQVRVQGMVTWAERSRIFLQNGQTGIQVSTVSPVSVHQGECLDVVGFPTPGSFSVVLQDSIVRQCSNPFPVQPRTLSAAEILSLASAPRAVAPDNAIVRVTGEVLDKSESSKEEVLTLQDGDLVFSARLPRTTTHPALSLREGSRVRVSGICVLQVDDLGAPHSFDILLRSPGDVNVLAAPGWFTLSLAIRLIAVLVGAACLAVLWIAFLGKRIRSHKATIQKQAKRGAALEQRLRELVEHASDMVYLLDADGCLLHVNEGMERRLGYNRSELLSRSLFDLIVPEQRALARDAFRFSIQQLQSGFEPAEWRFLTKAGSEISIELNQRIQTGADRHIRVEGIGRDVTARKQVMFEYQERFRTLADNIPQLAWIADAAGSIVWFNQRWFEYTGATLESSRGWAWLDYHHPEHVERVVNRLRRSFDTSESWEDTFPLRGADGQFRWFLGRAVPIRDDKGQLVSWFGTNTDITRQKQVEDELQRSNSDLTQFAYIASHDLQEPLRNIASFAQLLSRSFSKEDSTPLRRKYLDVITSSTERMEALILDLLAYSRATGSQILERPETSLQIVLDAALENLQTSIRQSGTRITHDPLPTVSINPVHFTQVFQNLIGNSIKYRRADTPLHIHIGAQLQVDAWQISVEDNGSGFQEEYAERVFGIFKRLHGREVPGTGIGLSICRAIVERHGGRIWAHGKPGEGATFFFTIPASSSTATLERAADALAAS